jgi:hypothetical protein
MHRLGRRLRLVTADAGDDVAGALRSLAAGDRVFALVGTMLPRNVEQIERSRRQGGPSIAALATD